MAAIESSIIIPAINNWPLTHSCLAGIAACTDISKIETIVIDNASTDATPRECPALGKKLFGDRFIFIRNETNRNFAGASNQGAQAARGDFLIFMNNDAEARPGWYDPLMDDFRNIPNIAGTGPLLAYPDPGILGLSVQHLGVIVNPWMKLFHLYQGIPADSPLARKRRFFQAITAACMAMPRALFLGAGGFDENFINGFEDVDLCARLWAQGRRFTVNPASMVLHHESRTPGRSDNEEKNSRRIAGGSMAHLGPDWTYQIGNDGLEPVLDKWAVFSAGYPKPVLKRLDAAIRTMLPDQLRDCLRQFPLWKKGWRALAGQLPDMGMRLSACKEMCALFPTPENAIIGCRMAMLAKDHEFLRKSLNVLAGFMESPQSLRGKVLANRDYCADIGLEGMAAQYGEWLKNFASFQARVYPGLARNYLKIARESGMPLNPLKAADYNAWREGRRSHAMTAAREETKFSILMPVHDPDPSFFRAALDSVLAQTWPHWQLCLADDASADPRILAIISEYAGKDERISHMIRGESGHIAAATNSALELARHPWSAFMDHDDLLVPEALEQVAAAIQKNPGAKLLYSDEDIIDEKGGHRSPHFKNSRWDSELMAGQNHVCHLVICDTEVLRQAGGLKEGFPGAQDHELLLRLSRGLAPGEIVHIPRVLYGWRAHAGSAAMDIAAKAYACESAEKAVRSHLEQTAPGASVSRLEHCQWLRARYPLPDAKPLASIISSASFAGFESFLACRTNYPHEFASSPGMAKGEILVFLDPAFLPYSRYWLEELVACLWRPGIGAVGGSLIAMDGRQLHAGYLADSTRQLKPLFRGAAQDIHDGWLSLARTVDAVDGLCLLTRKKDFEAMGGLDAQMGQWAFQDYCLRLRAKGQKTIWWPFACFIAGKKVNLPEAPAAFHAKWRLDPFNSNLRIEGKGFALESGAQDV